MTTHVFTRYYLSADESFDDIIAQLLPQCRAGHGVRLLRADGVTVVLSAGDDGVPQGEPSWRSAVSVNCDLCRWGWRLGYVGVDINGKKAVSLCPRCAAMLRALPKLDSEGGSR